MLGQELVPVVMKIADQRHRAARVVEAPPDLRQCSRGFRGVDRHAHELGSGVGERVHLRDGCGDIGGVGVRHRLHDDRRAAADAHPGDIDATARAPYDRRTLDRGTHGTHLSATRATPARMYGERSSRWPRKVTSTSGALPSASSIGGAAETVCVMPEPPVICTTTRPFASLTSTHDVPRNVRTSDASDAGVPAAGVWAPGAPTVAGTGRTIALFVGSFVAGDAGEAPAIGFGRTDVAVPGVDGVAMAVAGGVA